jgi:glycosyltransferase involved in cell wall biosynthesis
MLVNPKISVIVPVYNTEQYLHKCIESILSQSFTDFEVLLINDGSTDKSGELCDEYANKDTRIRVFHKENRGVSSARNTGLDNAKGEFSIHIDSDDWIEEYMLEKLYKHIINNNSAMVICDYYYHFPNSQLPLLHIQQPTSLLSEDIICDILRENLHGSNCNKLVKHFLYKEHNISFPENINYFEDMFVTIKLLLNIQKISYLPEALYHYRYNGKSISHNLTKSLFLEKFRVIESIENIILGNTKMEESLLYLKLQTKKRMFDSKLYTAKEIKMTYPECNKFIIKSSYHIYKKIFLYLICVGLLPTSDIVINTIRFIKVRVLHKKKY